MGCKHVLRGMVSGNADSFESEGSAKVIVLCVSLGSAKRLEAVMATSQSMRLYQQTPQAVVKRSKAVQCTLGYSCAGGPRNVTRTVRKDREAQT